MEWNDLKSIFVVYIHFKFFPIAFTLPLIVRCIIGRSWLSIIVLKLSSIIG